MTESNNFQAVRDFIHMQWTRKVNTLLCPPYNVLMSCPVFSGEEPATSSTDGRRPVHTSEPRLEGVYAMGVLQAHGTHIQITHGR